MSREEDNTIIAQIVSSPLYAPKWEFLTTYLPSLTSIFEKVDVAALYGSDHPDGLAAGNILCELRFLFLDRKMQELGANPALHTQYVANVLWAKRFLEMYRLWKHPSGVTH